MQDRSGRKGVWLSDVKAVLRNTRLIMMMMRCSLPPMIPVHAKRLPCSFPGDDWELIENDGEFNLSMACPLPSTTWVPLPCDRSIWQLHHPRGDRSNVQIYFCACTIDETTALHNAQLSASFP